MGIWRYLTPGTSQAEGGGGGEETAAAVGGGRRRKKKEDSLLLILDREGEDEKVFHCSATVSEAGRRRGKSLPLFC